MNADIDPRARLKHILSKALLDCSFEATETEAPGLLLLTARRPDGKRVQLRFRGVKESRTDPGPEAGAPLVLRDVGGNAVLGMLVPPMFRSPSHVQRVRIDAGAARLEIVCEDVEWWEDTEAQA